MPFLTCAQKNISEKIRRFPRIMKCFFRKEFGQKARVFAVSEVMHIARTVIQQYPVHYRLHLYVFNAISCVFNPSRIVFRTNYLSYFIPN